MKILVDNGHGVNTKGKCSPDKSLLEYEWTREVAARIVAELRVRGMDASLLVPELEDISLRERTSRVNRQCSLYGAKNVLSVSVHVNAAGADGQWHTAQGWSVFVSENASNNSKRLCRLLCEQAERTGRRVRRPLPQQNYWVKSLAMTRDTKCPAVLTENFFMDNEDDCEWLLSEEGKAACVRIHVDAICEYIETI